MLAHSLQGPYSVAECSVEFRSLGANSGWNDESLKGVFLNGLSDQVKDELAARDEPDTFN